LLSFLTIKTNSVLGAKPAPRGRAGPQDCKSWKAKVATECFHGNGYPAEQSPSKKTTSELCHDY